MGRTRGTRVRTHPIGTVQRLGDVVAGLPAEELEGLDLRALVDATVHRPEPGDTLAHVRRMETV